MIEKALITHSHGNPSCGTGSAAHNNQGYSLVELLIVVAIIATLAAIAIPLYSEMVYTAHVTAALGDIRHIQFEIDCYVANTGFFPGSLAAAKIHAPLDPWGRPYQYFRIAGTTRGKSQKGARKDKNLVPLNKDYDLYSKGRDGDSKPPITAQPSWDDIIRANNGGFIGLATNY